MIAKHWSNLTSAGQTRFPGRCWMYAIVAALFVLGAASILVVGAQYDREPSRIAPQDLPTEAGIRQKLNAQVPLDIRLRDATGTVVRLGDLVHDKPVVLNLVYFECPMLCKMTMDGQVRALTELELSAGDDYTALTVSFDPREDTSLAAGAKRMVLERYGRSNADRGWRFLTGDEPELRRLTESVGFHYKYDAATGQFAHAAGLIVLTPQGIISRYLYGVEFSPRDLRLALVEASAGDIGTANDQVLLLCYQYDPTTGKYGLAIMTLLRLSGLVTVLSMGFAIVMMLRHDRQRQIVGH